MSRLDDDAEHEAASFRDRTVRPHAFSPSPSRFQSAHSRESSAEKFPQLTPPTLTSPRAHAPLPRQAIAGGVIERPLDPSKTVYGHHRQTSIVHGIQHSRNGSLASSAGPISPQMIAAAGAGLERPDMQSVASRLDADAAMPSRPTTALAGPMASPNGFPMERSASAADMSPSAASQRNPERVHSKSRRDHPTHQSHSSRHHRDDQKTVGEYALHVLFTSVMPLPLLAQESSRR